MKLYFFNEVRTNNFTDPEVVAKIAGLEEFSLLQAFNLEMNL